MLEPGEAAVVAAACSASSTVPRVQTLAVLATSGEATRKEIADLLGEPPEAMGYSIKVLMTAGLVEETRTLPGATAIERFYSLTEYGRAVLIVLGRFAELGTSDVLPAL